MKGKVLGFDAAAGTGVINGEDGKRYAYTAADNKSPNPTRPNDEVDFVADGANAKDIFVMMAAPVAAAAAPIDMSKIASDPTVQKILAKPNVIWAGVVVLGSLLAGYLFGGFGILGQISGPYGTGLGLGGLFFFLLLGIPALAITLIVFELMGNPMTSTFRLLAGAAAAGGPIILPMLGGLLSGAGAGVGFNGLIMGLLLGGTVGTYMFGMLVTIAGGALILLTHFGYIKKLG